MQNDLDKEQNDKNRGTTQDQKGLNPKSQMKESRLVSPESPAQPENLPGPQTVPSMPKFKVYSKELDVKNKITFHIGPVGEESSISVTKIKTQIELTMEELIRENIQFPLSEVLRRHDQKDLLWFLVTDREPLPKKYEELLSRILGSPISGEVTEPIATWGLSRSDNFSLEQKRPKISEIQFISEIEKLQSKVEIVDRRTITLYSSILRGPSPWTLFLKDVIIHEMLHLAIIEAGCESSRDNGETNVTIRNLSELLYYLNEETFIREIVGAYLGGWRTEKELKKFHFVEKIVNKQIGECPSLSLRRLVCRIVERGKDKLDIVFQVPELKKGVEFTEKESKKIDFLTQHTDTLFSES